MRKSTNEKLQAELEKKKQIENHIKQLQKQEKEEERKKRTKRLIERGAIIESMIENPAALTNVQFQSIVIDALALFKKQFPAKIKLRTPADKAEGTGETQGL